MTKSKRISEMLPMGSADLRSELLKLQSGMHCVDEKLSKLTECANKTNSSIEKIAASQDAEKGARSRIEN